MAISVFAIPGGAGVAADDAVVERNGRGKESAHFFDFVKKSIVFNELELVSHGIATVKIFHRRCSMFQVPRIQK